MRVLTACLLALAGLLADCSTNGTEEAAAEVPGAEESIFADVLSHR